MTEEGLEIGGVSNTTGTVRAVTGLCVTGVCVTGLCVTVTGVDVTGVCVTGFCVRTVSPPVTEPW